MKYKVLLVITFLFFFNNCFALENEHGVELSALTVLTGGSYASFGYNYFNYSKAYEIAIPVVYNQYDQDSNPKDEYNIDVIFRLFSLDASQLKNANNSYRYFYFGAFPRLSHRSEYNERNFNLTNPSSRRQKVTRYGLGINFGYKRFFYLFKQKFYWGASISFGEYLTTPPHDNLKSSTLSSSGKQFYDIELGKFGYVF